MIATVIGYGRVPTDDEVLVRALIFCGMCLLPAVGATLLSRLRGRLILHELAFVIPTFLILVLFLITPRVGPPPLAWTVTAFTMLCFGLELFRLDPLHKILGFFGVAAAALELYESFAYSFSHYLMVG